MTVASTSARDYLPRHLKLAGEWAGLDATGLRLRDDGSLELDVVPDAGSPTGPAIGGPLPAPAGVPVPPGGLALGADGWGWVSDPVGGRVRPITTCDPEPMDDGIQRRPDDLVLDVDITCGLLLGPRGRLYVADGGRSQVQVLDPATSAVTGLWPIDGASLASPWSLCADQQDRVYVLDRGGPGSRGRIQRFDPDGVPDRGFENAVVAAGLTDPIRIARQPGADAERLLIVDRGPEADRVVALVLGGPGDGQVDPVRTDAWAAPVRRERDAASGQIIVTPITRIAGLAALGDRIHLVDADRADLVTFTADGRFIGSTRPVLPIGDVAAGAGRLWTWPLSPAPLLAHRPDARRLTTGAMITGPVQVPAAGGRRELRARLDQRAGTHTQLWIWTRPGDPPGVASLPGLARTGVADPDPPDGWRAFPIDVTVGLAPGDPAAPLWIGAALAGDGTSTPALEQLSVTAQRESWLKYLPAIYRSGGADQDMVDRLLLLIRSLQSEIATEATDLARQFDPVTADGGVPGSGALDRLASWVAVLLDERWPAAQRQAVVEHAFERQALAGTRLGLTRLVAERLGVGVVIQELALTASIWALDDPANPAGLGVGTMLAAGPADGAVLSRSAVVGAARLTAGADAGAPLFADLAHRFTVTAPESAVRAAGGPDALRAVIDAGKPAHTVYELCLVAAQARVGVQSTVGVDCLVAGPPARVELNPDPDAVPPEGLDRAALSGGPLEPDRRSGGASGSQLPHEHVGELRIGTGRLA